MTDIENPQHLDAEKKSTPWPLYIILGMVAFVLVSGYLLSPKSEEGKLAWIKLLGTTNQGILINPPVEVTAAEILAADGNSWAPIDDNTWKLLVLVSNQCDQACVDRLKELHAMRIRLNRDADRLTIGLLSPQEINVANVPEEVAGLHDINIARIANTDLLMKLEQTNMPSLLNGPVVLLMNPIDVFMMAYSTEHTGTQMLEDFEHLLDLAH